MKLLDIFKVFQLKSPSKREAKDDGYLPSLWEDDYCQIGIVPYENKEYILKTFEQINGLVNNSNGYGFTEIFERGTMPVKTFSKEIRIDYLENLLAGFEFEKAKNIKGYKRLDCETGLIKAYGFPSFTVFFDTEGEFVKNIWLSVSLLVDVRQYRLIKSALYSLGEECDMVLVDWNELEVYDLKDKSYIDKYLKEFWK